VHEHEQRSEDAVGDDELHPIARVLVVSRTLGRPCATAHPLSTSRSGGKKAASARPRDSQAAGCGEAKLGCGEVVSLS
jgi:hypothetical protein